jgi:endogenous inhibitor of DNA gyrase (YacG/DUF329 family)
MVEASGMGTAKIEILAQRRRQAAAPEGRAAASSKRSGRGDCPICGAPPAARYRPFCSARCADVDLARWLNESYRVPGDAAGATAESEESEPD